MEYLGKTTPNEIIALFGGQTAVSRILGLKSARHVRRVCAGTVPMPESWLKKLKEHAETTIEKLEGENYAN